MSTNYYPLRPPVKRIKQFAGHAWGHTAISVYLGDEPGGTLWFNSEDVARSFLLLLAEDTSPAFHIYGASGGKLGYHVLAHDLRPETQLISAYGKLTTFGELMDEIKAKNAAKDAGDTLNYQQGGVVKKPYSSPELKRLKVPQPSAMGTTEAQWIDLPEFLRRPDDVWIDVPLMCKHCGRALQAAPTRLEVRTLEGSMLDFRHKHDGSMFCFVSVKRAATPHTDPHYAKNVFIFALSQRRRGELTPTRDDD